MLGLYQMRVIYLSTTLVLALVLGFLIWQSLTKAKLLPAGQSTQTLLLKDLPTSYCPTSAKYVIDVENTESSARVITVKNCREIDLGSISSQVKNLAGVSIKLPKSLPFRLNAAALTQTTIEYAPELGDVNNDGVIDSQDESQILKDLFLTTATTDVDGDKKVTVTDLVYARLHRGTTRASEGPVFTGWDKEIAP